MNMLHDAQQPKNEEHGRRVSLKCAESEASLQYIFPKFMAHLWKKLNRDFLKFDNNPQKSHDFTKYQVLKLKEALTKYH